jgi:GH15 family glucan-1,4-alpha-glucosidase
MALRIEDYAVIGDCVTSALVGRDGSIDWLCWPRFDSSACFAALLGDANNGRWSIAPNQPPLAVQRHYRPGTLILETIFETPTGTALLIDFMPITEVLSHVVRIVIGQSGIVTMALEMFLRFDYGSAVPWVSQLPDGSGLQAVAGPNMAVLRSPVPIVGRGLSSVAEFEIRAGESLAFTLTYELSHRAPPPILDVHEALLTTENFWREWSGRSQIDGPWAPRIQRSLLALKALTYAPTGGVVAAPTTSLPEQLGGPRNWDYRYCWLRDATLTLMTLMRAGYYSEAEAWRRWLVRAVAGSPAQLQIMYGIAGERRLDEWEIPWLAGYENSLPVRIGNAASNQLQLDVYGELMDALHQARKGGLPRDEASWAVQAALVTHLESIWMQPDEGIWEVRGGRQHFTYSKIMVWVAFDRAVKSIDQFDLPGPREHWCELRDAVHAQVCERGFDAARNTFTQSYGSGALDASLLQIAPVGFLPADDPRVRGTIAAIERELLVDGFVQRYRTEQVADGLPAGEGVFLPCSFWLADNYILQGRYAEAETLFERLLALCNDVGLLAEEYDAHAQRLVGNFPQAFTHTALIHTGINLTNRGTLVRERKQ